MSPNVVEGIEHIRENVTAYHRCKLLEAPVKEDDQQGWGQSGETLWKSLWTTLGVALSYWLEGKCSVYSGPDVANW